MFYTCGGFELFLWDLDSTKKIIKKLSLKSSYDANFQKIIPKISSIAVINGNTAFLNVAFWEVHYQTTNCHEAHLTNQNIFRGHGSILLLRLNSHKVIEFVRPIRVRAAKRFAQVADLSFWHNSKFTQPAPYHLLTATFDLTTAFVFPYKHKKGFFSVSNTRHLSCVEVQTSLMVLGDISGKIMTYIFGSEGEVNHACTIKTLCWHATKIYSLCLSSKNNFLLSGGLF
jgi:hypothetical protein